MPDVPTRWVDAGDFVFVDVREATDFGRLVCVRAGIDRRPDLIETSSIRRDDVRVGDGDPVKRRWFAGAQTTA